MVSEKDIKSIGLKTIDIEANAVAGLRKCIDNNFVSCVEKILASNGRVVITGIGKSAIVANKIVATLNSTGTPAIFMHAADAIHGDLGMIAKDDVVIAISKSGNTPEIKGLVPLLKQSGNILIGMVGNLNSYLAVMADIVIDTTVEIEACPNNLAPTSSTTAQMVMGDALAVCLLECREFSSHDFARYHPGGALGKRLYLKVKDIVANNPAPKVNLNSSIKDVILEITSNRLGATVVQDGERVCGIITDGDIRRMLEVHPRIDGLSAKDIMNPDPKTIGPDAMAVDALQLMSERKISQLVVVENSDYKGIIHLWDLNREGII